MSKRVLCKFFAHGACLKGEHCEYSHDWNYPSSNICTYYQKGKCSYGTRCRYDHLKPSRLHFGASSSTSIPFGNTRFGAYPIMKARILPSELSPGSRPFLPSNHPTRNLEPGKCDVFDGTIELKNLKLPSDRPLCCYAATGNCPRGEQCPHIHGDLCPNCGRHCLHPLRPEEREEHMKTCEKMQKHLDALKHSQEIECCVCLDKVLFKSTAAERKFGLLSECDHPFCIGCIRNWRSSSPTPGTEPSSMSRTCPVCRKLSYFVVPSVIWYSCQEEKTEIIDNYKAKLSSIDCKHFNFGIGNCPFGSSCFYKHGYKDGRLEEVVLRHLGSEDGHTVISKNIRLDCQIFLEDSKLAECVVVLDINYSEYQYDKNTYKSAKVSNYGIETIVFFKSVLLLEVLFVSP